MKIKIGAVYYVTIGNSLREVTVLEKTSSNTFFKVIDNHTNIVLEINWLQFNEYVRG